MSSEEIIEVPADDGIRSAIRRTAAKYPLRLCLAVFLGCAIDVLVILGVRWPWA